MKITHRCGISPHQRGSLSGDTCPDVLCLENGDYLVIGKTPSVRHIPVSELAKHGAAVGPGEQAVVVPADVMRAAAQDIAEHSNRATVHETEARRACTNCEHFICDGDGPCGAIVALSAISDEKRCPCTGPAVGAQQPGGTFGGPLPRPSLKAHPATPSRACRYCPDETCPEDCPECGAPIHDLGEMPPKSAAYARLEKAVKEATEAAHLHAMQGMKRVYQLCLVYGTDTTIPAAEVLKALGLDENANTIEATDEQ